MKYTNLLIISLIICVNCFGQNLLNNPEGAVFDSERNRYLISNFGDGNIIQIDSLGEQSYFNQDCNSLAGMQIVSDTLYTLDYEGSNPGLKAIRLSTGKGLFTLHISRMKYLNDITADTSGNLYITDTDANKIFKVKLKDMSYTTFVSSGLNSPDGILFDKSNNRLLVVNDVMSKDGAIEAVSLTDSTMVTLIRPGIRGLDGITQDEEGNFYLSSWDTDKVYKYDQNFQNAPEVISEGYTAPGDIYFCNYSNTLVVPDFYSNSVNFIPIVSTQVEEVDRTISKDFCLMQNFPNPFNPSTKIRFEIPNKNRVILKVFDVLGKKIMTLIDEEKEAGIHEVEFNSESANRRIANGIYFYRIEAGNFTESKKMILLK